MNLRTRLAERARALTAAAAGEEARTPDGPAARPGARAVYARILDGDSLWLAVTGTDEPVVLRHEQTGEVVEPTNDAPPDPAATSYRWHLPSALPDLADGVEQDAFLLVTSGSGEQVRVDDLPELAPMRTPPTSDGRWQLEVRRRDGGAVVVGRERRSPAAEVVAVTDGDDGAVVELRTPDGGLESGEPRLLLVDAAGTIGHEGPVDEPHGDGLLVARLAPEAVPPEPEVEWFLTLRDGSRDLPLVRSRNDLARPGFATVLPILWEETAGVRRTVRLRFQTEGRLRAHRPAAEDDAS